MNRSPCEECYRADCVCDEDIEEVDSSMRKSYPTNELAVNGALEQMANIETVGQTQSIEQANAAHVSRMQSAQKANDNDARLMNKLRAQNKKAYEAKKLTGEMVYPKSRWSR